MVSEGKRRDEELSEVMASLGKREAELSVLTAETTRLRAMLAEAKDEAARHEGVNELLRSQLAKAQDPAPLKAAVKNETLN